MFEEIVLAILSGLGRRYTRPGRWIHLPFRGLTLPIKEQTTVDARTCSRTND
jgi:hypothetical protein